VVSALGEELSRVSLAAMGKVLQDGFLRHREAFHLLVPQRPLGELFGSAAGEQLRKVGVAVELETPVLSIDDSGQQSIRVTTSNREYQAEALVLATAWHQLAKVKIVTPHSDLLERLERAQLLQSSTISGIHTWWDRAWLPTPHAAVVGRLCQWVFPKPMLVGAHNSNMPEHYYQIVVSASQSLELGIRATLESSAATRESWGHTIHDDLAKVFPRVREAKLLRFKVVSDPKAVFSVQPDVLQYRAPAQGSARVMLAGDWTRTGWPATMEGAVLSGFRAAELLLNVPGRCVAQPL
jgi:glycine/D-amino acid oxidase-like deaminating enzyme